MRGTMIVIYPLYRTGASTTRCTTTALLLIFLIIFVIVENNHGYVHNNKGLSIRKDTSQPPPSSFAKFGSTSTVHVPSLSSSPSKYWKRPNYINNRIQQQQQQQWKYVSTVLYQTTTINQDKQEDTIEDVTATNREEQHTPRPFHQNWWPVTTLNSLDKSKPNALQLLGKPLVAFYDSADSSPSSKVPSSMWRVLDDRCAHRFAPLSEGRICKSYDDNNKSCTIQCAYHGWEFDGTTGSCTKIPQLSSSSSSPLFSMTEEKAGPPTGVGESTKNSSTKKSSTIPTVTSYHTQERAGILWVWADPESYETVGKHIPIPISSILDDFVEYYGENSCFMRDLPYGMEILGENLLDVSHLPFSHHGSGALRRELGGELPMRMLSFEEKKVVATESNDDNFDRHGEVLVPLYQAEIVDAGENDPIFQGYRTYTKAIPDETWTVTAAFFEPNHIRYRRLRGGRAPAQQEIFLCPLSPGRSRVFLFNSRATIAPKNQHQRSSEPVDDKIQTMSVKTKLTNLFGTVKKVCTLSHWKSKIRSMIVARLFDPRRVPSHMVYNGIFDGDGIFLHKQGSRMQGSSLTYRDYSTPASSDILLNAYRRYMDQVAMITATGDDDNGSQRASMAQSVVGYDVTSGKDGDGNSPAYDPYDTIPRSILLDRYDSHTKHCPVCMAGLKAVRRKQQLLLLLKSAVRGAFGSTALAWLTVCYMIRFKPSWFPIQILVKSPWFILSSIAPFLNILCLWMLNKLGENLDRHERQFFFEDYVHAEKN